MSHRKTKKFRQLLKEKGVDKTHPYFKQLMKDLKSGKISTR